MIADALLDQLLDGADARTAFDTDGLIDQLKKALAERALNAEMDHHLVNGEPGNSRNGYGRKTVTTGTGRIELEIPRDRAGSFDPALIAKYSATQSFQSGAPPAKQSPAAQRLRSIPRVSQGLRALVLGHPVL